MREGSYWWQKSNTNHILSYTYSPSRIEGAERRIRENGPRFEQSITSIINKSKSEEETVRNITRYIQQSVIHNPIFQPSRSSIFYSLAGRYGYDIERSVITKILLKMGLVERHKLVGEMIEDPDLLIELGEARCGQCAKMLCEAFKIARIKSNTLQLESHVITEVFLNHISYVIDADIFKHGIFIEVAGRLATRKDILENPYLVDVFKPTGLMFRRDSVYVYNQKTNKPYAGYIDLFSPEIDGQISAKYGASKTLYPPGIPKWKTNSGTITLRADEKVTMEYFCPYSERAIGYRIKCGRKSKGYSYDRLIFENLANETSGDVFEIETKENYIEWNMSVPGIYYVTVASIPYYYEEFKPYLWWSDELMIKVIPCQK